MKAFLGKDWLFNLFSYVVLLQITITFFTVNRVKEAGSFFEFDVMLVIYIIISMLYALLSSNRLKILQFTSRLILFLYAILLPSLILLLFSNEIKKSLEFIVQYYFIFLVIPLFINYIIVNKHVLIFMWMLFTSFFLIALMYTIVFIHPSMVWSEFSFLGLSEESLFGFRFFLGEFTPNEMGHYFVLFLLSFLLINKFRRVSSSLKVFIFPIVIFTFIMTLSKTVWIQIFLTFIFLSKSKIKIVFIAFVPLMILFLYWHYQDFVFYALQDFSLEASGNQVRVNMFYDSISYLPYSIFQPAFHADENVFVSGLHVTSAHNAFLSFISNFGLISFILLLIGLITFLIQNVRTSNVIFVVLILINFIVYMFNPLINARHVWLPIFLLIYVFYFYRNQGFNCCLNKVGRS